MSYKKNSCDFNIIVLVSLLLSIGVVMVFSSSAAVAFFKYHDPYYFLKRQLLWAILGFGAMVYMMNFDYWKLKKYAKLLFILSLVLLVLVLVPGIGMVVNGARRWIGVGFLNIQPSEFAKLATVIYLSNRLSDKKEKIQSFFRGLLPNLIILGIVFLLIIMEPNLSIAGIIIIVGLIMLFIAGARWSHMITLGIIGLLLAAIAVIIEPYRLERVLTFLDPWKDMQGSGYQVIQSLYALGSGGIFGVGLGNSRQKLFYIPEPQNDFIFSIIGEELGFIGAAAIIFIFLALILRGFRIAAKSPDTFACLLASGITSIIAVQSFINIAVVTSSMPPTGVPLPFISAGGSSMLFTMAGVGILLNISRYIGYNRG